MLVLKTISEEAIPMALKKAERYRLLNEPREAESICRDILEAEPDNQEAISTLILALTDQFGQGYSDQVEEAKTLVMELKQEYERHYFMGVVLERWGKNQNLNTAPRYVVHDWLREAMRYYEQAEAVRPEGNDDAILRWNTCARIIMREASPELRAGATHTEGFDFGDEAPVI